LDDLRNRRYFSFSAGSAPNLSCVDQQNVTVRYVPPNDGFLTECFMTLLESENHNGESRANKVLNYHSNDCKADFSVCRVQVCGNSADMVGGYNIMQQILLQKNK
jgi:hypothetical protein